jgi:hypothetical protein
MVEENLKKSTFGFLHSNIDVQYFPYNEFIIDKINEKLENIYGKKIDPITIFPIIEDKVVGVEKYVV